MAATTHLMTVEEFASLPEDHGETYHELFHGEPVAMTRPKRKHERIQVRLLRLLMPFADPESHLGMEITFRPFPEHELWVADVAYMSRERFMDSDAEDYTRGAPELVIEILSPSNTATEMLDKEEICLANGTQEFWLISPDRRRIKVTTRDGRTMTFESGQGIPLFFATGGVLNVDDVFRY
jgi:Uma2 family endonuclease